MKRGASALAALAALVALPSLANGFVYDDVLLILQNPLVHGLSRSSELWHSTFWPAGMLYRPLTLQLFAAEWALGGGRPLVFHLASILLYAGVTALVYLLVSRVLAAPEPQSAAPALPWTPAVLAAAFFAVHPVHVEVVANVAGQSELLAALFALLAVERYFAWRQAGALSLGRRLALAGLTLLALLSKETGYVTPLLLAAAELTLLRRRRARVAEVFLLQGAAIVLGLLLRVSVLGSVAGETPAAVFEGMGTLARATAMLAVVPHWVRLLLWPAHLQAAYGPPELPVTASLGFLHVAGLLIAVGVAVALLRSRTRSPVAAFGILWILLALGPVSNGLAPTGLLLAERVLFLPSVGFVLLLAVLLEPLLQPGSRTLGGTLSVAGFLILLGVIRSVDRADVWRTQDVFFTTLVHDAPRTYRAHFVASRYYYGERRFAEAERAASEALALYDRDPQVHEQLGQILRVEGRCGDAIPVLTAGVALAPDRTTLRSRLIECALAVGDTARARAVAAEAVRLGQQEFESTVRRLSP